MGNWKLEVFRMAMYVSFPVALFYVFNQPQFFEDYLVTLKKEEKARNKVSGAELEEFRNAMKQYQQERLEKKLQKQWDEMNKNRE